MKPVRLLLLPALIALTACDGCDPEVVKPDDTDPATDDTGPAPDACDDHVGEVLCIEGRAVTCDDAGDIASDEECVEAVCEDGVGCVACTADLADVFVLDDDEDSMGVVLVAHELGPDAPFFQQKMMSRVITVTAEAGAVQLSRDGDGVSLFDPDGQLTDGVLNLAPGVLPAEVFVVGETAGAEGSLTVTHTVDGCEAVGDSLRLRLTRLGEVSCRFG